MRYSHFLGSSTERITLYIQVRRAVRHSDRLRALWTTKSLHKILKKISMRSHRPLIAEDRVRLQTIPSWTKWQCDRFFSDASTFPPVNIIPQMVYSNHLDLRTYRYRGWEIK